MSSMTSYSVGSPASKEVVWESWNNYYKENEDKLLKELSNDEKFHELRKLGIINEELLKDIKLKFKNIYSMWKIENVSDYRRESIIKRMDTYILNLKVKLNSSFDLEVIKAEILKFSQTLKEDMSSQKYSTATSVKKDYTGGITIYLERLKKYDEELYNIKKLQSKKIDDMTSQKAKLFFDSLKLDYGKSKTDYFWSIAYKESISKLSKELIGRKLQAEIDDFITLSKVGEDSYDILFKKIQDELMFEKQRKEFSLYITSSLEKLNYVVIDKDDIADKLSQREKVVLPVINQDYQVVVALNNDNKILTRFIKTVKEQKDIDNLTSSQRLLDKEHLKKWCHIQSKLQENLQCFSMEVEQKIIEDKESDILYIVDKSTKQNTVVQNIIKGIEQYG